VISWRYHVVSIVAVVLAFGLGVLAGTSVVNDNFIADIQANYGRAQEQRDAAIALVGLYEEFADGLQPTLLDDVLIGEEAIVVTMEALAPFRTAAFERPEGDPQPLDYLNDENNRKFGGLDINFEVYIQTERMRSENIEPHLLSSSNSKDLYWTVGQMLTHHASNGCNLQTGDLIASGTVSGREKDERGCLLELTWRGTEPIELPSGETRRFLEDGDEIIMKGYCEREGFRRIGFGECRGRILPAD